MEKWLRSREKIIFEKERKKIQKNYKKGNFLLFSEFLKKIRKRKKSFSSEKKNP